MDAQRITTLAYELFKRIIEGFARSVFKDFRFICQPSPFPEDKGRDRFIIGVVVPRQSVVQASPDAQDSSGPGDTSTDEVKL